MAVLMKPLARFAASLLALTAVFHDANAQDDLLQSLEKDQGTEKALVYDTWKTTRLINMHSTETLGKRNLDFRITHRFDDIAGTGNGVNTLFGLDNAVNIRFALEYGITDRLMTGFGRSSYQGLLDGFIKYRLLEQTTQNSVPVTVTLLANAGYESRPLEELKDAHKKYRFSYLYQAIIARKVTGKLSVQVAPTLLHRNLVAAEDANQLPAIGVGGRYLITRSFSIMADYFYIVSDYRHEHPAGRPRFYAPLAVGAELETGGHVFHVNFTNAVGILENQILADTRDSWDSGAFKFGFNISRTFSFQKRERSPDEGGEKKW